MTTLQDIKDELPIDDYCYFVEHNGKTFYEISGKKFELNVSVDYVLPIVKKIHDNYGARAKQAKENDGVDWKAISHALRAGYQLKDIFQLGDFEYPLRQTQFLLDVKQGKLDYVTEVAPVLEELVEELEVLSKESNLPEQVDTEFWDDFVFRVYTGEFYG